MTPDASTDLGFTKNDDDYDLQMPLINWAQRVTTRSLFATSPPAGTGGGHQPGSSIPAMGNERYHPLMDHQALAFHRHRQEAAVERLRRQGTVPPNSYYNIAPDGRLLHPSQMPYPEATSAPTARLAPIIINSQLNRLLQRPRRAHSTYTLDRAWNGSASSATPSVHQSPTPAFDTAGPKPSSSGQELLSTYIATTHDTGGHAPPLPPPRRGQPPPPPPPRTRHQPQPEPTSPCLSPPIAGQASPFITAAFNTDPAHNAAILSRLGYTLDRCGIWQQPPGPTQSSRQPASGHLFRQHADHLMTTQLGTAVAAARAVNAATRLTGQQKQAFQMNLRDQQSRAKQSLTDLTTVLVSQALAPTTRDTSNSAKRRFQNYITTYGIVIDRAHGIETTDLANYITYLWNDPNINSSDTIEQYISNGVRRWHLDNNIPWVPLADRPLASAAMAGARRLMTATGTKKKLPITVNILNRIFQTIDFTRRDELAWSTAVSGGFLHTHEKV